MLSLSHMREFPTIKTLTLFLLNPFPAADDCWKHCDKSRNCSIRTISSFVTMCSTFFSNNTYILSDFLGFCLDVFKVVCCRFVICGKGLSKYNRYWEVICPSSNRTTFQIVFVSPHFRDSGTVVEGRSPVPKVLGLNPMMSGSRICLLFYHTSGAGTG